jgi:putative glycosyltransferase (TIGR04372 family)
MKFKNKYINTISKVIIFKWIFWTLVQTISIILLGIMSIINLRTKCKIILLRDDRIGHLIINSAVLFDEMKSNEKYIALTSDNPCNHELIRIISKKIYIIYYPNNTIIREILLIVFSPRSIFGTSKYWIEFNYPNKKLVLYKVKKKYFALSNQQEIEGKKLLTKMGLSVSDWFVCFHARDNMYLRNHSIYNLDYHKIRNSPIEDYLQAADYIAKRGGYAIRMGAEVEKKLEVKSKRIIDYATRYRTELGDIYLPSKAKFFLGNTSGIQGIAPVSKIPLACANVIPLGFFLHLGEGDLFIPKKIYSKKLKRILSFKEMVKKIIYYKNFQYQDNKLEIVDNSPLEIKELTIEMFERLEKKPEETILQKKFKKIFKRTLPGLSAGQISSKFLKRNQYLLK